MTPALSSIFRRLACRRRSSMLSAYFLFHSSFPRTNYSSRSRYYSTNNHHESAQGPLLMRPAVNVANDGEIYDQFYDPVTGNYEIKERNKQLPDTAKIFASSRGWVGFVDPSRDCTLYLVNPTHADAHDVQPILLPTIESISYILGVKRRRLSSSLSSDDDSSDMSVSTFYVHDDDDDSCQQILEYSEEEVLSKLLNNPVLSTDPRDPDCKAMILEYSPDEVVSNLLNNLVLSADPRDPGCIAMIVFGQGIAFCKPGIDYGWMHQDRFYNRYKNRAFYQPVYSTKDRMFYHLVHDRNKYGYDDSDEEDEHDIEFQDASIDPPRKGLYGYDWNRRAAEKTYLVVDENSGDLYLVYKLHPSSSTSSLGPLCLNFEIHRLGLGGRVVDTVTSIGDLAFFIGPYECFALSANDFPQIQPNSIYLVHNELEGERYSSAAVIYNLRDRSVTPFVCPYASCKLKQRAFWLAPLSFY